MEGESYVGAPSDETGTQDFILISGPVQPLGTLPLFRDAMVLSVNYTPLAFFAKLLATATAKPLLASAK